MPADVVDVVNHRRFADFQRGGDFLRASTHRQQRADGDLPRAKACEW
jgi:hypothetical protein